MRAACRSTCLHSPGHPATAVPTQRRRLRNGLPGLPFWGRYLSASANYTAATLQRPLTRVVKRVRSDMADHDKPIAVLVVHGIGQQMPMDTLRSLVTNVFGSRPDGSARQVFSKVDRDSTFLDLRRLVLPAGEGRGRVDFFELYWAPVMSNGSAGAVILWGTRTILRRARGRQMAAIVRAIRLYVLALVILSVGLLLLVRGSPWWSYLVPLAPLAAVLWTLVRGWGRSLITEALADAARWFSPRPQDITERDRVRQLGLDLLRDLHRMEDGRQRYGRVIVLGHSLGSVVAYDVLRLAFDALRAPADMPNRGRATRLEERQPAAWHFAEEARRLEVTGDAARFQYFQSQLHREQSLNGVPWLVTDLITLASPLTHADDLWSTKVANFDHRVEDNEYPTCPPQGEVQHSEALRIETETVSAVPGGEGRIAFYRKVDDGPLIAHEASPFASTRWTNLYIPMRQWLAGDPVGGPLAPTMGKGVRDIAVNPTTKRWSVRWLPVRAHTAYWDRDEGGLGVRQTRAGSTASRSESGAAALIENGGGRRSLPDTVSELARVIDLDRKPAPPFSALGGTRVEGAPPERCDRPDLDLAPIQERRT